MEVGTGALAVLSGLRLEAPAGLGLGVSGTGTRLAARDVTIVGPLERGPGVYHGLQVQAGAAAELQRASFARNLSSAASVYDVSRLDAADVRVSGLVSSERFGEAGTGLILAGGAQATVERWVITNSGEAAVAAQGTATSGVLRDVRIEHSLGNGDSGDFGYGLTADTGATLDIERTRLDHTRSVGLVALDTGTMVSARDIAIDDTLPAACTSGECAERPYGVGLGVYLGARAALTQFAIRRATLRAVHIAAGELDLADGQITESQSGVCLSAVDTSYDLDRLTHNVRFVDNGTNLQSVELPVPRAR